VLDITARGDRLYITGTVNGERVRRSTGLKVGQEAEARRLLTENMGPRVSECADEYIRSQRVGTTSQTYIRRFVDRFGPVRLGKIDVARVYAFFSTRKKAPETVRREIGAVQAMLNWSARANGVERTFNIQKPRAGEPRLRFLEQHEVQAMIENASSFFRPFVVGLFYSGMRRGELAGLVGRDMVNGQFIVATAKGRGGRVRHRSVPVHPEIESVLPTRPGPHDPLFVNEYGEAWVHDLTRINKLWKETASRAGVEDCVPHDARRTFASRLLESGVDIRTIAALLGHEDLSMLMRYAQVRGQRKVDVMSSLVY